MDALHRNGLCGYTGGMWVYAQKVGIQRGCGYIEVVCVYGEGVGIYLVSVDIHKLGVGWTV